MTTTPNYSFTIAEGTDTVNLLTQSYPNFTNLDTILKTIEDTGITTSVATKVGTVFNIVRTNTDLAVMRFVATANYVAGDTFTVDGVAVTATAMNGTALPTGAFVINQSVECILNGAVLTVVGVAGITSIDASDVTYDNTGSGLVATDVQDAIDEVNAAIPTGFAATAITYDNTLSGLTATEVQAAIDELASSTPTAQYVEVVADGVKTIKQLLNGLYALIDFTKVTPSATFVDIVSASNKLVYHVIEIATSIIASRDKWDTTVASIDHVVIDTANSSKGQVTLTNSYANTDQSSIVLAAGRTYRFYY